MGEREPICAACGRPISVCAADADNCATAGSVDPNPTSSEWRVVDSYSTGGGVHDSWRALGPWRATQEEARRDAAAEARVKELEAEEKQGVADYLVQVDRADEWHSRALKALNQLAKERASKAALIREVREWAEAHCDYGEIHADIFDLNRILAKHEGKP